jgi:hypothetical protein
MTYSRADDLAEEEWEEEDEDIEEWDDLEIEDEEDELWLDDDEY